MSLAFDFFRHKLQWPASQTPAWADHAERWYQLDPAAFALADAYWTFRTELGEPPGWLLLASPGASNYTDAQFAASDSPSPAKFVHTLPNIRGVSLLQLMKWSGQVLCLQKDPGTVSFALTEAFRLAEFEDTTVWVATVRQVENDWTAAFYKVGREGHFQVNTTAQTPQSTRDAEWFEWLDNSSRKYVAEGYEIIKK